ncbi:MAG: radical SAM protein [Candidatus Latescibacteria bacterium]|nr:radical SAM protein [Candidatus Latescibacterota bacterium]NIO56173.1 radical SAM protein [Candidatus Latescibacterota bacterium]
MKVLLISANTERINMLTVPWGLACVAGATQSAGHEVSFLDLLTEEDPHAAISRAISGVAPDVIGISVRNIDDQNRERPAFFLETVKQTVAECRRLTKAPIVLGGAGYSIFPDSALDYLGADMGIQGEGETAFLELLERMEQGADLSGLPGLYLRGRGLQGNRRFIERLDTMPFPEGSMLSPYQAADPELWLPVQTRRGCFMKCSYCSTVTIEGQELRQRSPELVVGCVSRYVDAGFRRIFFVDNNFNIPKSYALEVSRSIANRDLDFIWRCILHPSHVDEELIRAMASAGCREVSLGFESGCEQILKNMNKKFSVEDIRRSAWLLARYGMRRMGFLLLGGPGETKESVEESLAFADSLGLEAVRVTAGIRVYPHTQLANIAVEEGVVAPEDDLLFPRFYLAKGLENWLEEILAKWKADRPHWIIG